ncbi:hypothetical protein [Bacillus sp. AK031]
MKPQEPSYPRRYRSFVSPYGANILHSQNPHVIAWWSAAFPGFGHILLQQHIRGTILSLFEVTLNFQINLNLAMVYSFTGKFEMAKSVLNIQWGLVYVCLYLFTIYNSYQVASFMVLTSKLAKREHYQLRVFSMNTLETYVLNKLSPWTALVWSLLIPGAGQIYTQRYLLGFFALIWWMIYAYLSNAYTSIQLLFLGDFLKASTVLNPQWFMFMPSVYMGAAYHSYITAVEINKLFKDEQRYYLSQTYQKKPLKMP